MTFQNRQPIVRAVSADEIERLLHHMPTVAQTAKNDWTKGFAQSVVKQARRKGWSPSGKQLAVMRELVSDLFAHGAFDMDGEVIE